jgi:hypothetical protein
MDDGYEAQNLSATHSASVDVTAGETETRSESIAARSDDSTEKLLQCLVSLIPAKKRRITEDYIEI